MLTLTCPRYTVQSHLQLNFRDSFSTMPRLCKHVRQDLSDACTVTHHRRLWRFTALLSYVLSLAPPAFSASIHSSPASTSRTDGPSQLQCLPEREGFLRARLDGSITRELSWSGTSLTCAGSIRPSNDGLRMRFSSTAKNNEPKLALLFGITGLKEGTDGKALPVNLTIMVEGKGEFYSTQGDSKCTADEVRQVPLQGIPSRQRSYRVTARGFCTQPARALNGDGAVLVSRFDFSGRADYSSDDTIDTQPANP